MIAGGPNGIIGRTGWYVPDYFRYGSEEYVVEFYRDFLNPDVRKMLPLSGFIFLDFYFLHKTYH